jgi:hypothetical protein
MLLRRVEHGEDVDEYRHQLKVLSIYNISITSYLPEYSVV